MDTHQRQRVVVSRPVAGHWDRAPATRRTRRRLRQRPARRCSQARQASRANSTERPSIALIASSSCPTRFPITGGGTHVPVSASRSFCEKGLWRATRFPAPGSGFSVRWWQPLQSPTSRPHRRAAASGQRSPLHLHSNTCVHALSGWPDPVRICVEERVDGMT